MYGFPSQRAANNENALDIKHCIEEVLGGELALGSYRYAGRKFTIIDDDGLVRLGRFALTLMSHLPRGRFIRSVATGCASDASEVPR